MTTPFWSNAPTILFNKEQILQLWPTQQMTFEDKLNAISRIVIIMTILGFFFYEKYQLVNYRNANISDYIYALQIKKTKDC
jgi:hypothetical protein